ncbi:hypothetical protein BDP27DRAFT_1404627 [Rhodocollybia butyracea]|uniref:Uncharacterized protein n=1 Tax=Rhodocollybia butyracea TaxID=206335 RepID=A0A9P5PMP1_9AGAR|nr:hypothetical protein BDP27DRAFT_1404627 [Rhodocollybia butyracea]
MRFGAYSGNDTGAELKCSTTTSLKIYAPKPRIKKMFYSRDMLEKKFLGSFVEEVLREGKKVQPSYCVITTICTETWYRDMSLGQLQKALTRILEPALNAFARIQVPPSRCRRFSRIPETLANGKKVHVSKRPIRTIRTAGSVLGEAARLCARFQLMKVEAVEELLYARSASFFVNYALALICPAIMLNDDLIRDLLSLALVSRIFLEPALDTMWKSIVGIEPVLSVLPEASTLTSGMKMFTRPIDPSSWDRLHFYTSHVRKFSSPPGESELNVLHSVWMDLGKGKPIFPKLRSLHLSPRLCNSNKYTLFLATSLQVVSGPRNFWCLLGLESLSVMYPSHLEVDFIQAIALLPKLTYLSLAIPAGIALDYAGIESGFPSLTKVVLWGSTSDTRKVLAVVSSQALQDLLFHWRATHVVDLSPLDITLTTRLLPTFPFLRDLVIEEAWVSSLAKDLNALQL